jgi:hypothetical protein
MTSEGAVSEWMSEPDSENMSIYNTVDSNSNTCTNKEIQENISSKMTFFLFFFGNQNIHMENENKWNYLCFCVGICLSTAPVISTLFWAPVLLNHHYAGIGNGCFFLVYAFTSLCLAKSITQVLGCGRTFWFCHAGNLFYCLCFMIEFTVLLEKFNVDMSTNGAFYPLVASIGGFSQSLMWTAHVKYFNRSAQLMLKSMNVLDIENLNRSLASTFAFTYFTCLIMVFLISCLVLFRDFSANELLVYLVPVYLSTVVFSTYCLCRLDHMGDNGDDWANFQFRRGLLEMMYSIRQLPTGMSRKLLYLIPYHVAWGCTNAFWVYYMLGEVVNNQQGWGYIGVVCVIDFSTSLAFSFLSNKITKWASSSQTPMIIWGWMCMTTIGLLVLTLSNDQLGTRRRIVGYAMTHGMARSVYENNHKALIANFFPEHETVAYSVTSFSKTLAAGITFFYYSFLVSRNFFGGTIIVTSFIGIAGYWTANIINTREISEGYQSMRPSSVSLIPSEATSESLMFVADYF